MLRDDAVLIVQQMLGFRTDLTTVIIRNMKLAQTQLELGPTKPWFLLSEDSVAQTTPLEHRLGVPDDFLSEDENSTLVYVPDDTSLQEVILKKRDLDTLQLAYSNVYTATADRKPVAYALRGKYFWIFPLVNEQLNIRMVYYKKALPLDSNIENDWLKEVPYLLIGKAGLMLSPGLRDLNATQQFQQWEAEGRVAMRTRNEDRDHTGRDDYAMGGEE